MYVTYVRPARSQLPGYITSMSRRCDRLGEPSLANVPRKRILDGALYVFFSSYVAEIVRIAQSLSVALAVNSFLRDGLSRIRFSIVSIS